MMNFYENLSIELKQFIAIIIVYFIIITNRLVIYFLGGRGRHWDYWIAAYLFDKKRRLPQKIGVFCFNTAIYLLATMAILHFFFGN